MLIISKFRDYYDASVGYGLDKTVIYKRDTKVIKSTEFFLDEYIAGDTPYLWEWVRGTKMPLHEWKIIGFCGKTYVMLIEKLKEDGVESIEYFYGQDALQRVFFNKKEIRISNNKTGKRRYKETKDFVDKWHNRSFTNFFIENRIPIFIVVPKSSYSKPFLDVIVNPILNDFKFYRIFDSYSTFQEIQMFISGVMGTGFPKTLEIDNKEKIRQHGFDLQWSFRNPNPPKRKQ